MQLPGMRGTIGRSADGLRREAVRTGRKQVRPTLGSDRSRFVVFAAFALLVALMGGSSRPDIPILTVLRPAVILFGAYALWHATMAQIRIVVGPLLVVLAMMALALLQLVPLPPEIWSGLPRRAVVAEATELLGMDGIWRPVSLDPDRTWNAFFALFVPVSGICLVAIQAPGYRRLVVPTLMFVGVFSALLGYLQAIGGNTLHLYSITHRSFPVGLFANKNHQAVMLLWLMLAGSWMAASADLRRVSTTAVIGGALASILVLFPLVVLTGSRAGMVLSPFALLLCGGLLFRSSAAKDVLRRAGARAKIVLGLGIACLAAPLFFVFAVLATSGRETALSRLFELDATDDLRWQHMPVMLRMARDFLPFGSGFGAFESVFNMYEPADMLTTRYMNQAHNDLLQIVIEGGLPAGGIFLAAMAWLLQALARLARSPDVEKRRLALFYGGSIALWLGASIVDYPLRTPLAAMVVACLTAHLAMRSSGARSAATWWENEAHAPAAR